MREGKGRKERISNGVEGGWSCFLNSCFSSHMCAFFDVPKSLNRSDMGTQGTTVGATSGHDMFSCRRSQQSLR